jgi:hypothetical protein
VERRRHRHCEKRTRTKDEPMELIFLASMLPLLLSVISLVVLRPRAG